MEELEAPESTWNEFIVTSPKNADLRKEDASAQSGESKEEEGDSANNSREENEKMVRDEMVKQTNKKIQSCYFYFIYIII